MSEIQLPRPFKIGGGTGQNRWFWYEIVDYVDQSAGRPRREHDAADMVKTIGSAEVKEILGGVSDMWLWRRLNQRSVDLALGTSPRPAAMNKG
jgi:predicted DNA-binding transcriptional regulator AlpA